MSMLRIALVHSNVCFKVVDMECNHELLCTGPSPSPLPILFSNFGIENSLNFYHVNVSDGSVKLSGYISGPCETLALKAIQYIYINSRFICKGPIHKLLNQLAAKFDLSNSWKPATDSHSEKQNRLHLCPTFVLNLNCPRSYYDIVNSERSKTTVEFKDWVSVLTFVETGIKRLWMENISHDMPVTSESGRKRRRNCRTSIDLSSPLPNKPSKKYQHIPDWEESPSSPGMPIFSEVKMHKEEISFLPDTDYISQSCNKLLADHRVTKNPRSSTILSPSSVFSPGHQFMAYTSGKQEGVRSNAASLDILPKFVNNVSVRSGISSDCLDLSDEIDINHGVKKSFLRSCSVRKNLPDRTLAASDESFEFLNDAFGRTNKSIDFDNCVTDDFKLFLYGREIQSEGSPLLRLSPRIQFDMPERSKFDMGDLGDSSFVFKNMLLDSPVQVQKYLKPQWTPIKDKQSIRFLKDDVVNGNFFENHYEFGEDTRHGYPTWRDDYLIESNLNTKVSWLEQDCSSLELTPYLKGCNYRKRESDVLHWDNCEDSLPYPSKSDIDWSFSPSYGEESSKNYSTPKLYDSAAKERGCGRPNSRERTKNRKKGSVRSHSAPPFFRGKKRFSGLSDSSSILSARSNTQIINKTIPCTETGNMNDTLLPAKIRSLKYSQKSSDHYQPSPVEKSVAECSFAERPSSGRTPEVIRIQNGASQKSQLIDKDSLECLDLKEIQDPFNPGMKWRSNCSPIAGGNNTQFNYKGQDSILDLSSYLLCRSGDTLVPKSIDKTSLEHAEVLSQVDKKFIAVVAERTLCVIDQHAADERIRLEELRHKVLSGEMKTITYLDDEKELVLPEIGYQLLHNYADQIRVWGWICNIHSHDTSSFTKNLDFLHRRPSVVKLLAVPCILGVNLTDTDLLEFLQQLADTDGSSTIPPSVHYVLNSKACRGAIMFGDTLLPSECSLIVDELKRTSLCFQCAHGRPTTVPLVNLDTLNNKIAKLGSKNSWHGLRQHELTLVRMEQRLRSAC